MDVREKSSNEKRLIDADALLNEFLKRYMERERNRNLVFAVCEIKQDFADMISDFQTVDAVEVVRCRDCRKFKTYGCRMVASGYDDFCSYGERKEGAD